MSMPASRIRSIHRRFHLAEEAAFPGIHSMALPAGISHRSSIPAPFRGNAMQGAFAKAGLA